MRDDPTIAALLERSNRLGADKRVTNFAGGNTSAKVTLADPITGTPTRVLAVKGSGGDLGTMTAAGLAFLDLDRVRALEAVHASGVHEDDIVAYYEYCRFGHGGAVPSIDTPLHAFITQDHVDHLHPDSMIALAAAEGSEALVAECYGSDVGWLPWKRPGFELGIALRDFQRRFPDARGAVLEGHGMICWADTSDACEALSLDLIARAEQFFGQHNVDAAFGAVRDGFTALPDEERRRRAAALAPIIRGVAASERPMVGAFSDAPVVLDFLSREAAPRLAAQGTSCPDHFLRTKVRPLYLDLPATATLDEQRARLEELHEQYRADYGAYYGAYAEEGSPAMRGADPVIVLVPGVGMWSFGADPQTARVAGEFYINAINVMRGAEGKLRMRPPAPALQGRVALVTGAASGIGRAIVELLARHGACVVVADRDGEGAEKVAADIGAERAFGIAADVTSEEQVAAMFAAAASRFGGVDIVVNNAGFATAAPLIETSAEDWDRLHAVLARGSFLVSRAAARQMIEQDFGGDIVYIVSKNAIFAGPQNIAYSAAKADQAHQVRLLAAELGVHDIRVNGVNPDGVVQGSGIFQGEWLRQRAETYGVAPEDLGKYYAGRTLLGREILPEHVAEAVFVLVGGQLSRTTGLLIPVDGGVAAAFLR
jgi:rhamnose utilization protein RhaD (predicted bifunctional aldolase and dehydrogenase)/NAD(P)-dependent dehydrogenase (short-subunit alcohol dehydrogenase family)